MCFPSTSYAFYPIQYCICVSCICCICDKEFNATRHLVPSQNANERQPSSVMKISQEMNWMRFTFSTLLRQYTAICRLKKSTCPMDSHQTKHTDLFECWSCDQKMCVCVHKWTMFNQILEIAMILASLFQLFSFFRPTCCSFLHANSVFAFSWNFRKCIKHIENVLRFRWLRS